MTEEEAWRELQAAVAITTAGCSVVLSPYVAAVLLAIRSAQPQAPEPTK